MKLYLLLWYTVVTCAYFHFSLLHPLAGSLQHPTTDPPARLWALAKPKKEKKKKLATQQFIICPSVWRHRCGCNLLSVLCDAKMVAEMVLPRTGHRRMRCGCLNDKQLEEEWGCAGRWRDRDGERERDRERDRFHKIAGSVMNEHGLRLFS